MNKINLDQPTLELFNQIKKYTELQWNKGINANFQKEFKKNQPIPISKFINKLRIDVQENIRILLNIITQNQINTNLYILQSQNENNSKIKPCLCITFESYENIILQKLFENKITRNQMNKILTYKYQKINEKNTTLNKLTAKFLNIYPTLTNVIVNKEPKKSLVIKNDKDFMIINDEKKQTQNIMLVNSYTNQVLNLNPKTKPNTNMIALYPPCTNLINEIVNTSKYINEYMQRLEIE